MEVCPAEKQNHDLGNDIERGTIISISVIFQIGLLVHFICHLKDLKKKKTKKYLIALFAILQIVALLWNLIELIRMFIASRFYPIWVKNATFCNFTAFSNRIVVPGYYAILINILLIRFKASFQKSVYKVSNRLFYTLLAVVNVLTITLITWSMSLAQNACITNWPNDKSHLFCQDNLHGTRIWLVLAGLASICFFNILVGILFISRLHRATRDLNDADFTQDALYIMIKSTILSLFMVLSTLICWITFIFVDIGSFLHFDILFNCVVMSLSFFYNDSYYQFLCGPMIGCCNKCIGYNYLIELQMMANINHGNETKVAQSITTTTTSSPTTSPATSPRATTLKTVNEKENNQIKVEDDTESDPEVP